MQVRLTNSAYTGVVTGLELLSNLVFKTVIKQRSDLTQLPQYHP